MQFEITDRAAIRFAEEFYAALVKGFPVDAALAEARKGIYGDDNDIEWGTPVLFMRIADGRIFDLVAPNDEPSETAEGFELHPKNPGALGDEVSEQSGDLSDSHVTGAVPVTEVSRDEPEEEAPKPVQEPGRQQPSLLLTQLQEAWQRSALAVKEERFEDALVEFGRALEINPKSTRTLVGRGWSYYNLERYEEALREFITALKADADHVDALVGSGSSHFQLGQFDDALADFDRALKLNPNHAAALEGRRKTRTKIAEPRPAMGTPKRKPSRHHAKPPEQKNTHLDSDRTSETRKAQLRQLGEPELSNWSEILIRRPCEPDLPAGAPEGRFYGIGGPGQSGGGFGFTSVSPCALWAGSELLSTVITTQGFFFEPVRWQIVVLPPYWSSAGD